MYFPRKGFGFVSHPLNSKSFKDVFFHISNVQKSHKEIANKLLSYERGDDIYFWYEVENTRKGEQLKSILEIDNISGLLKLNLVSFTKKVEYMWQDIEKAKPVWLSDVTLDLVGIDKLNELKLERENLKNKRKEEEELRLKEQKRLDEERRRQKRQELREKIKWLRRERLERIKRLEQERLERLEREKLEKIKRLERERIERLEQEKLEKIKRLERLEREKKLKLQKRQYNIEEEEFELLVAEVESKGFTMSAEVSHYIIRNRLGNKYKNISGVLEMENSISSWKFNGGFPPKIYARLCERLNLGNKGTDSRVVRFTPFKDL